MITTKTTVASSPENKSKPENVAETINRTEQIQSRSLIEETSDTVNKRKQSSPPIRHPPPLNGLISSKYIAKSNINR